MNCIICGGEIYDRFNDNYIVSFCSDCNLEHITFPIFLNIIKTKLLNKKYNYNSYKYIFNFLETDFGTYNFGLIKQSVLCKVNSYCKGSVGAECHIYQYDYHNFKFYFCFFQDLIIYNPDDIDILLNYLLKKNKINNIKNKINNIKKFIKKLFIKEEGIENVKK